jgi:hypothetical protein
MRDRGSREVEAVIIKHPVFALIMWSLVVGAVLILIAVILTYCAETS